MKRTILTTLVALMALLINGTAQTTIFNSTADSELYQNGGPPLGGSTTLRAYPWAPSWTRRFVLKFDLSGYSGCVDTAYVILWNYNCQGTPRIINVHRLTTNWSEATATWAVPWAIAGGDFDPAIVATYLPPPWLGTPKIQKVFLTESVRDFTTGTYPNFGWLFKIAVENTAPEWWGYNSKEIADSTKRPKLKIICNGYLPVELLSFDAEIQNEKVKIFWSTASEINSDYFAIQRSQDAVNFEQIGTMQSAGNSNTLLNYAYYDENPYGGISYYRLKQVDFDGSYTHSDIKVVSMSAINIINIYPNPAENMINILVDSPENFDIDIAVFNILGQKCIGLKKRITIGHNKIELNTSELFSGIYFYRVTTPNGEYIQKEFLKK